MAEPAFETSGAFNRPFLKAAASMGLLEKARPLAPPESLALIDSPPQLWAWSDGQWVTQLMIAINRAHGPDALREAGRRVCHESLGLVASPLMSVISTLSGGSPKPFYPQFGTLTKPFVRGIRFGSVDGGPKATTVTVDYPVANIAGVFPLWHGVLQFTLEFAKAKGTVTPSLPHADNAARFKVEWE